MSDTPDLSKIVSLIMQNPSLISEISALARSEGEPTAEEKSEATDSIQKEEAEPSPRDVPVRALKSERRVKLLTAMKPYLKDERQRSVDTVLTIAEILDMIRSK